MEKKGSKILHPAVKLMFVSESKFFGPGPVGLLREIDSCGNVRDACEKCGFSYSKGWTILKKCEEEHGYKIVERQAGGKTGGAAKVTEEGHKLMAVYDELEAELSEVAERRFPEIAKKHELK